MKKKAQIIMCSVKQVEGDGVSNLSECVKYQKQLKHMDCNDQETSEFNDKLHCSCPPEKHIEVFSFLTLLSAGQHHLSMCYKSLSKNKSI